MNRLYKILLRVLQLQQETPQQMVITQYSWFLVKNYSRGFLDFIFFTLSQGVEMVGQLNTILYNRKSKMEKKWHSIRSKPLFNTQEEIPEKQQFFKDVFSKCMKKMHPDDLQFFLKIIVPDKYDGFSKCKENKKFQTSQQQSRFIHDIKPNIFTYKPEAPYELNLEHIRQVKENDCRIVSTPKHKTLRDTQMKAYKEYVLSKKMKGIQNRIKTDIYEPQCLQNLPKKQQPQPPKVKLIREKRRVKGPVFKPNKQKNNYIPLQMISIIKYPERNKTLDFHPYRKSYFQ